MKNLNRKLSVIALSGMSNMDPYSTSGAAVGSQNNPLYRYSVDKGGFYVSEYTEALKQVYNNELLNIEEFEKVYNIAKKNYGDKVTPSKEFENKLNSNSGTGCRSSRKCSGGSDSVDGRICG